MRMIAVPLGPELIDDREELLCFLRGDGGRWLVEDEDPRPRDQRFRDLGHLLQRDAEPADFCVRIDRQSKRLQLLARLAVERRPIDQTAGAAHRLPAEKDVASNVQMWHQIQFLMNRADPSCCAACGEARCTDFPSSRSSPPSGW